MERSVKKRLERSADDLFSRHGYAVTPVRDVMAAAKVVPRSFYDHFQSKKELGILYLRQKEEESMRDLLDLMRQNPEPARLFRAWVLAKKRQIKRQEFFGCPFLRFALQMPEGDAEFQNQLRSVAAMWQKLIREYLEDAIRLGHLPKKTDTLALARRALAIYEGNIAMWRISGEKFYLDQMPAMFEGILAEAKQGSRNKSQS
jgi:AcrR family transcriptional regulator